MSEDIIKILVICLISSVTCVLLKQKGEEYALLISVSTGTLIGIMLIRKLLPVFNVFNSSLERYNINIEYFEVALKSVGIGYLTSFVADSCRDCGQTSLAAKAEFAGKCAIFILSVPLMLSILETAIGFIQ